MTLSKQNKKWIIIGVIALIVVIIVGSIIGTYNSMVTAKEGVTDKESTISIQLQRRNDLIPNLVSTVKGYAAHEEKVISDVTDARAKLAGAKTSDELANADAELSSALNRLMVVVENYPDLKASENFRSLQVQLEGTENRITVARNDFNKAAREYNTYIKKFPKNIFASIFGFDEIAYFEAEAGAEVVPEVKF